jgi:hypothetical protein
VQQDRAPVVLEGLGFVHVSECIECVRRLQRIGDPGVALPAATVLLWAGLTTP